MGAGLAPAKISTAEELLNGPFDDRRDVDGIQLYHLFHPYDEDKGQYGGMFEYPLSEELLMLSPYERQRAFDLITDYNGISKEIYLKSIKTFILSYPFRGDKKQNIESMCEQIDAYIDNYVQIQKVKKEIHGNNDFVKELDYLKNASLGELFDLLKSSSSFAQARACVFLEEYRPQDFFKLQFYINFENAFSILDSINIDISLIKSEYGPYADLKDLSKKEKAVIKFIALRFMEKNPDSKLAGSRLMDGIKIEGTIYNQKNENEYLTDVYMSVDYSLLPLWIRNY